MNVKPLRYVRTLDDTVGLSEIQANETIAYTDVEQQPLANLSDVTITTPTTGQVLGYDGNAWVNTAGGGGASSMWFGNLFPDPKFRYPYAGINDPQVPVNQEVVKGGNIRNDGENLISYSFRDLSPQEKGLTNADRCLTVVRFGPATVANARGRFIIAYSALPTFAGKPLTIRFKAKGLSGGEKILVMAFTEINNFANGQYPVSTITLTNTWQEYEFSTLFDEFPVEWTTGNASSGYQFIFIAGSSRYGGELVNEGGEVEITGIQVELASTSSPDYEVPVLLEKAIATEEAAGGGISFDAEDAQFKTSNKNIKIDQASIVNSWEAHGLWVQHPSGMNSWESPGVLRSRTPNQSGWDLTTTIGEAYGQGQNGDLRMTVTENSQGFPNAFSMPVLRYDSGFYESGFAFAWLNKKVIIGQPLISQPGAQTVTSFDTNHMLFSLLDSDLILSKVFAEPNFATSSFVDPALWNTEVFTSANLAYGTSWEMEISFFISAFAADATITIDNAFPSGANWDGSSKIFRTAAPAWLTGTTVTLTRPTNNYNMYQIRITNRSGRIEVNFDTLLGD